MEDGLVFKELFKMKKVHLLSYEYPDLIRVLIRPYVYTYRSSEVMCRRFVNSLNHGAGFHALRWFKGRAELLKKEEVQRRDE